MEITQRGNQSPARIRRCGPRVAVVLAGLIAGAFFLPVASHGGVFGGVRHTRDHFRNTLPGTVRPDHPVIAPVVRAIQAVTTNPLEQLAMVNDVTHLLVDYDDDERVYGTPEFHATLDEMLTRRRQGGWIYLRDDCDGRAVFAAHLLAALGIPWRLEASYWKEHAWVVARVNGREYDLLDLRTGAPETDRLSYKLFGRHFVRPSIRPPAFSWRRSWAQRTGRDFQVGMTLGLLAIDSKPGEQHERFATDWTSRVPHGKLSPVDDRALTARVAGFPLGEPLRPGTMAAGQPGRDVPPATSAAATLGVTTGSPSSGSN